MLPARRRDRFLPARGTLFSAAGVHGSAAGTFCFAAEPFLSGAVQLRSAAERFVAGAVQFRSAAVDLRSAAVRIGSRPKRFVSAAVEISSARNESVSAPVECATAADPCRSGTVRSQSAPCAEPPEPGWSSVAAELNGWTSNAQKADRPRVGSTFRRNGSLMGLGIRIGSCNTDFQPIDAEVSRADALRFTAASGSSSQGRSDMVKPAKNTICLWYDGDAEDAARFYAKTFPDSSVGAVHRAPGDFPLGKPSDCADPQCAGSGSSSTLRATRPGDRSLHGSPPGRTALDLQGL